MLLLRNILGWLWATVSRWNLWFLKDQSLYKSCEKKGIQEFPRLYTYVYTPRSNDYLRRMAKMRTKVNRHLIINNRIHCPTARNIFIQEKLVLNAIQHSCILYGLSAKAVLPLPRIWTHQTPYNVEERCRYCGSAHNTKEHTSNKHTESKPFLQWCLILQSEEMCCLKCCEGQMKLGSIIVLMKLDGIVRLITFEYMQDIDLSIYIHAKI